MIKKLKKLWTWLMDQRPVTMREHRKLEDQVNQQHVALIELCDFLVGECRSHRGSIDAMSDAMDKAMHRRRVLGKRTETNKGLITKLRKDADDALNLQNRLLNMEDRLDKLVGVVDSNDEMGVFNVDRVLKLEERVDKLGATSSSQTQKKTAKMKERMQQIEGWAHGMKLDQDMISRFIMDMFELSQEYACKQHPVPSEELNL